MLFFTLLLSMPIPELLAPFHFARGEEKGQFLFRLHNILFIWVFTRQLLGTYLYY